MKHYYYPRTLEGITTALLDMFNDMKVVRYDADGNNVGEKDVPVSGFLLPKRFFHYHSNFF